MTAAGAQTLPLTVLVLTRNEERDLPACLASVAGLGQQIIVLDSGSTDRTVAVAQAAGATVQQRAFTGYASQRNAALRLCQTPWALFLDADEMVTPAGRAEIVAVLARPFDRATPAGYWIPRYNEFFGRRLRGGGWWPDAQLRLLQPALAHYDEAHEVHEIVALNGPAGQLQEPLIHRNYDHWQEFCAKQRAYARRQAPDLLQQGVHPRPWTYATMPLREIRRRFLTLGGWHDGGLGLALALAMGWCTARTYWQLGQLVRQQRAVSPVPDKPLLPPKLLAQPPTLDLSIIIVSRNTAALTLRCLAAVDASLAASELRWETILVDNASHDDTVSAVRAAFPAVRLIEAGGNRGFAVGNNFGFYEARGAYLLLLNPDTEPVGPAIETLVAALQADQTLGAVGPRLYYPGGAAQSSRRRFPTRLTGFIESTLVQHYWPQQRHLAHYYLADQSAEVAQDVDWLMGACLLLRRAALLDSGGFDEGFFMYSEELDLCARLRAAGWRIRYEPAATVLHHEGASSSQAVAQRQINFAVGKLRYYRRQYGAGYALLLRWFLLGNVVVQLAQESGKWLLGHRRELRQQRIGAYLTVLRSGLHARGQHLQRDVSS